MTSLLSPLPLSPGGHRYGGGRSVPDQRDLGMARLHAPLILPSKIDLSMYCGILRDQQQLGACTAFAGTAMLEFLWRRWIIPGREYVLSPLFMYYKERELNGTLAQGDCGSDGRTAVKVINQFGVCPESLDTYDPANFANAPTGTQLAAALSYCAGAFHAIGNVQDMKAAIASDYGFITGFNVYDSFESDATAASGLMPVPDRSSEQLLGGHEVFFCGYDDAVECPGATAGAFKVQNSWGAAWGQSGFFWFPYQCAADPAIWMDSFIQHFGKPW